MVNKKSIIILTIITIILIALYVFLGISSSNFGYFFPRRLTRILGIIIVAFTISISTVIFQAFTNNRILTPNMLGFDSMYMLTQSAVIFILGSGSFLIVNQYANFITSLVVMVTSQPYSMECYLKRWGIN